MTLSRSQKYKSISWNEIKCYAKDGKKENFPSARIGRTFSMIGSNVFLFGGIEENEQTTPKNDLFVLHLQNRENIWARLNTAGQQPPGRWNHTASHVSVFDILIFGGFTSITGRLNDFWIFNTITKSWRKVLLKSTLRGDLIQLMCAII